MIPPRLFIAAFLALLALAGRGAAESVSLRLPVPGAAGETIRLDGFAFDDRHHSIRIVDNGLPSKPRFGSLAAAMEACGAVAGSNGGFFDPQGAPLGLMVAGGRATGRMAGGALTSGVWFRTSRHLLLLRTGEFQARERPDVAELIQAGPFVVDGGSATAGLEATKARTRTVILHDQRHAWLLAVSSPATLQALGAALGAADRVGGVEVVRALNLDGGSSSALWTRASGSLQTPLRRVRNFVAIVPK
jgi:uncharacterized protein YigE (DUF2233 family)